MQVLHQAHVVQMPLDSASDVAGLACVQSLESRAPAVTQNVDTCPAGNLVGVEPVDDVLLARVLELNQPAPLKV